MYPRSLMNQAAPFAQPQDPMQRLEDIERRRQAERAHILADARNEVIAAAKAWRATREDRYSPSGASLHWKASEALKEAVDALGELEK